MTEYYKKKLNQGLEYQDFIFDTLYSLGLPLISYGSKKYQVEKGENKAGFEIKFDDKFATTGNFWIEVAEKSKPENKQWIPSGIYRDDNTWLYLIGNYSEFYIFAKSHLQLIESDYDIIINNRKTSKGFLLPKKRADKLAVRIIKCGDE